LMFGATLSASMADPPPQNQDGITPKQLAALTSKLQSINGEITDFRLVADNTAAIVVSGKSGWELFVFKRASDANWDEVWNSGKLGDEFSLVDPHWKVYFSSCGPMVLQFNGCRKYECSAVWGIVIYDIVSGEIAEARSLDGDLKYSGVAGHNSRGCAKDQLQKAIAEKKSDPDSP